MGISAKRTSSFVHGPTHNAVAQTCIIPHKTVSDGNLVAASISPHPAYDTLIGTTL